MKELQDKAIQLHQSGLNCAQAVLTSYCDEMNFDNNLALSISCGFGGGMGRLQETCGAVTGAIMVLGIHTCNKYTENKQRKEISYSKVQQFAEKFKSMHGTLDCKTLLNCDLNTIEGQKYMKEHNLSTKVCNRCIGNSIGILEELIKD
jgi:C_GCAxxG_C_C family probable redox protein